MVPPRSASSNEVIQALRASRYNPEKAAMLPAFFRAFPGGYGEGDRFIGVKAPDQRRIAKEFRELPDDQLGKLLQSPFHEGRLTGLFILIDRFRKAKEPRRTELFELFMNHLDGVNNWDLVDSCAPHILGAWLEDKPRDLLDELVDSGQLWRQRLAMVACLHFIRRNDFADALRIAGRLVDREHDLIHKAVGWMLREIGNRDLAVEERFLEKHYQKMPRTMLRYAIEKFDEERRQQWLRR